MKKITRMALSVSLLFFALIGLANDRAQFASIFKFKSGTYTGSGLYNGLTARFLEPDWEWRVKVTDKSEFPYINWEGAAIAITNCSPEQVEVELLKGGLTPDDSVSIEVWSDQEMFDHLGVGTYAGSAQTEWEEGDHVRCLYCQYMNMSSKQVRGWPKDVWPSNQVISDRQWVILRATNAGAWSGSPQFMLGLRHLRALSPVISLQRSDWAYDPEETFGLKIEGLVNGTVSSDFRVSRWESLREEGIYGRMSGNRMIFHAWFDNPAEASGSRALKMRIHVPSAGMLVVRLEDSGYYCNEAIRTADNLKPSVGSAYASGTTVENYKDYGWIKGNFTRKVPTTQKGYVDFEIPNDDGLLVNNIAFYPTENAVAVTADVRDWSPFRYTTNTPFWVNNIGADIPNEGWNIGVQNTIHCRVSGTGVYQPGGWASLICTPGPGEVFDHWEFVDTIPTSHSDLNSPTLSFEVPNIASTYPEMHVRPVLKNRQTIITGVLPGSAAETTGDGNFTYDTESHAISAEARQSWWQFVSWQNWTDWQTSGEVPLSSDRETSVNLVKSHAENRRPMICIANYERDDNLHTETVGNITWTYRISNGKAIICRNGQNPAFSPTNVSEVNVPETLGEYPVTGLDECVFQNTTVSRIHLPASLTDMDEGTLAVETLKSISIADGNTTYRIINGVLYDTIRQIAFMRASATQNVFELVEGTKRVASSCFAMLTNGRVTLPSSVTSVGSYSFAFCNGLELYPQGGQPWTGTSIFKGTTGATVTVTPGTGWDALIGMQRDGVTVQKKPGSHVFSYVENADGVTLTGVADGAPTGELEIPASYAGKKVTVLGWGCFKGMRNLTSVTIPEGIKTIEGNVFHKTGIKSVTIPSTVESIYEPAFPGCSEGGWSGLTSIAVRPGNKRYRAENGYLYDFVNKRLLTVCVNATSVVVPSDCTSIGCCAFTCCRDLKSVTLPEGLTEISGSAFESCYSLNSLTMPTTLTQISIAAFIDCEALQSLYFPGAVPTVTTLFYHEGDQCVFAEGNYSTIVYVWPKTGWEDGTGKLISSWQGRPVKYVPGACEYNYAPNDDGEDTITLTNVKSGTPSGALMISSSYDGKTVTQLGPGLFMGNSAITSVTVPSTIRTIGMMAFAKCSSLSSVTLSEGLQTIEIQAFWGCPIAELKIPASVQRIDRTALMPESTSAYSVTAIGKISVAAGNERFVMSDGLLYDTDEKVVLAANKGLTSVTVPEGCEIIGSHALSQQHWMQTISFPSSLRAIEKAGLACNFIKSLDFSNTELATVGFEAFKKCWSLTTVRFPGTLTSVSPGTPTPSDSPIFENDSALTAVYFAGGIPEVPNGIYGNAANVIAYVLPKAGWDTLVKAGAKWEGRPVKYAPGACEYNYAPNDDGEDTITLTNVVGNLPTGELRIPSYYDNKKVTRIGAYAFEGCKDVTSAVLPEGLLAVGDQIFCGVPLTAINVPKSLINITEGAFAASHPPPTITVADGNPRYCIKDGWLYDKIDDVVMAATKTIWDQTSASFPEGSKKIGRMCWGTGGDSRTVTIPASVTTIAADNFFEVNNVTIYFNGSEPTIDSSRQTVEGGLFAGSTNVKLYVLPGVGWDTLIGQKWHGVTVLQKSGTIAYTYEFNGDGANKITLTNILNEADVTGTLEIPSTYDGYTVTRIDSYLHCKKNGGVHPISKLIIPSSVKVLGKDAFCDISTLKTVVFNEGLEEIGLDAFCHCGITAVNLPASLQVYPDFAFGYNPIERITVAVGSEYFMVSNNLLIAKANKKVVLATHNAGDVVIPEGVEEIGNMAFEGDIVTSFKFPTTLKYVWPQAFNGNKASFPTTADFSACVNLTNVDSAAFVQWSNLTTVKFPSSLKQLGAWAFARSTSLREVYFYGPVPQIVHNAKLDSHIKNPEIFNPPFGDAIYVNCGDDQVNPSLMTGVTTYVIPGSADWDNALRDGTWQNCSIKPMPGTYAYNYTVNDDNKTVTLRSIISTGVCTGELTLPSQYGEYEVSKIANSIGYYWNGQESACHQFTKVTIPGSVKVIEEEAFDCMSTLREVVLNEGLEEIGEDAFLNGNITSIKIPKSVKKMGPAAFGQNPLTKIEVADGSEYFEVKNNLLINKKEKKVQLALRNLGNLVIPEGVEVIGQNAFEHDYISSIKFPSTLKTLEPFALHNGAMQNNTTAEYDFSGTALTTVGGGAFARNESLKTVRFPTSLSKLYAYAFGNCTSLTGVYFASGKIEPDCDPTERGVAEIIKNCQEKGIDLSKVNSQLYISQTTSNHLLANAITYVLPGTGWDEYIGKNWQGRPVKQQPGSCAFSTQKNGDGVNTITLTGFIGDKPYGALTIPATYEGKKVTRLDGNLCAGNTSITSVDIPSSVLYIGWDVFRACPNLSKVTLHEGLRRIDGDAFRECNVSSIKFPASLTTYTRGAFDDGALAKIEVADGNAHYHASADGKLLINTDEMKVQLCVRSPGALTIPEGVRSLGDIALARKTNLTSVEFPTTLEAIEKSVFNNTKTIASLDFSRCQQLSYVGGVAFNGCTGLTKVVFPASLKEIGSYTFIGCTSLQSVTFSGKAPTVLKPSQEKYADGTLDVNFDNEVCEKLPYLYYNKPNGDLYVASDSAALLPNVTTYVLPGTGWDDYIGKNWQGRPVKQQPGSCAFAWKPNSDGTDTITLTGVIGDKPYGALTIPATYEGKKVTRVDDCHPDGAWPFYNFAGVTSIIFPADVIEIAGAAFEKMPDLTSITLPANLRRVDAWAFNNCPKLTSLKLPKSVESIGIAAFNSPALARIEVEAGNSHYIVQNDFLIEKATRKVVMAVATATSMVVPDDVEVIESYAFQYVSSASIAFPASLEVINPCAFANDRLQVTTLDFSQTALREVGYCAFGHRGSLQGFTRMLFPKTLTTLGAWAMGGNFALTRVEFAGGVPVVQEVTLEQLLQDNFLDKETAQQLIDAKPKGDIYVSLAGDYLSKVTTYVLPAMGWGDAIEKGLWQGCPLRLVEGCHEYDYEQNAGGVTLLRLRDAVSGALNLPSSYAGYPVTKLGAAFLAGNTTVTSVTVPAEVESFGDRVFANCSNLKSVTFLGDCPDPCGTGIYADVKSVVTYVTPDSTASWGGDEGDLERLPKSWQDRPIVYIGNVVPKDFDWTVGGYFGYEDNAAHGITIQVKYPPADMTILYSTDGITFSATFPKFKQAGTNTVFFQISAKGYYSGKGFATVQIDAKINPDRFTTNPDAPVDYNWIDAYASQFLPSGRPPTADDYEKAAVAKTGKKDAWGRDFTVHDEFVMGTKPDEAGSVFHLELGTEEGKRYLKPQPDMSEQHRVYTYFWKKNLSDEWKQVTEEEIDEKLNPPKPKMALLGATPYTEDTSGFFTAKVELDESMKEASRKAQLRVTGGDLDGDGALTAADIARLQDLVLDILLENRSVDSLSEKDRLAADANSDGLINIYDLLALEAML